METLMKLGLLVGGLVLACVPRSFLRKLEGWQPADGARRGATPEGSVDRSLAGPRAVGIACVALALLSLFL
jgi:hypothetical protein